MSKRIIRFVDLFAGTGGIRLGLQQALDQLDIPYECVKSVEIDKKACETYQLNFSENPYGDIRDVVSLPGFDILLAGFPCQAFSYAGKQLGFADTRGTLFFEVERILEKYRPPICLLENVRGLTTHDHGKTFATILQRLNSLGYNVEYRLINASTIGVPQNRTRIYIICTLKHHPRITIDSNLGASDSHSFKHETMDLFSVNQNKNLLIKDILEEDPPSKYDCSRKFTDALKKYFNGNLECLHGIRLIDTRLGNSVHSWDIGLKGNCTSNEIAFLNLLVSNRRRHIFGTHQDGKALTLEQIKHFYNASNVVQIVESLLNKRYLRKDAEGKINLVCGNMSFEVFKFLDPNSISITLTASDANRLGVFHRERVRRITPRECARIQGYPDSYVLHPLDSCAYKQLGNAVCVPVICRLFVDLFTNTQGLLTGLS